MTTARTSDGPPKAYVLDLTPEDGVDLSTVSAAVFEVRSTSGVVSTWPATMSNQTSTTLRLSHVYAVGVFPATGDYSIYALLSVPGGTLTSAPRKLKVLGAFDV